MSEAKLTEKQKRFCMEYLKDLNATQAAIRAGYSAKTAKSVGSENLTKPDIQAFLSESLEKRKKDSIATADEVLEYLTSVVRGTSQAEVIVNEKVDGMSQPVPMMKHPDEKDRLKAAEIMAKYHGLMAPQQVEVKAEAKVDLRQFEQLMEKARELEGDSREAYMIELRKIVEEE